MTSTRSSLDSLQELYPALASLPPARFTGSLTDDEVDTDMEKEFSQHGASTIPRRNPVSSPLNILLTLAYIAPPLCILYATLLGYVYGCPFILGTVQALAHSISTSADMLLAAALLVSSAGLITPGVGFLWEGELPAGNERI